MIVGAGIIGLTIARHFLTGSDLSIAIVDKAVPCSGATGAGNSFLGISMIPIYYFSEVRILNGCGSDFGMLLE